MQMIKTHYRNLPFESGEDELLERESLRRTEKLAKRSMRSRAKWGWGEYGGSIPCVVLSRGFRKMNIWKAPRECVLNSLEWDEQT